MASITTFFGTSGGGSVSGSGTATRVAFWDGTTGNPSTTLGDSSNLEWYDSTNILAVGGPNTVQSTLTIAGATASDSTSALEVRTNLTYGDKLLFRVYDNGRVETRTLDSAENTTNNIAIGFGAGQTMTTGVANTIVGDNAGANITVSTTNTLVGANAGASLVEGSSNTAIGTGALQSLVGSTTSTGGSYNIGIGQDAGRYKDGGGIQANSNSFGCIYIGNGTRASVGSGQQNEIAIGINCVAAGSNTVSIGNAAVTDTYLKGNIHLEASPAIVFDTASGTKIGSDPTELMAFYGKSPNSQPTTSISGATFVTGGGGVNIKTDDTFGGYTIGQIAAALIRLGLLA